MCTAWVLLIMHTKTYTCMYCTPTFVLARQVICAVAQLVKYVQYIRTSLLLLFLSKRDKLSDELHFFIEEIKL